jgi:hypothetical protein
VFRHGRPAEWALALPIGSFLLFRVLRDFVAWVTASASERDEFRAEIERARADREQARLTRRPMARRECVEYLALRRSRPPACRADRRAGAVLLQLHPSGGDLMLVDRD